MKIPLFIITLALIHYHIHAQVNTTEQFWGKNINVLSIKPSITDASIKNFDTPHLVLYNKNAKQGKILLYLPGSNGIATNGPKALLATALQQGYRVISLSYVNSPAVSTTCIKENLASDVDCAEKFRIKRIYGKNVTNLINDEPQDAIMNRFQKLLLYLAANDKNGNWNMYLNQGNIKWELVAISGQSQGGGMAAFIAKQVLVDRVISFSGGWDYSAKNQIAKWYYAKSITPAQRWYATYHVEEPTAKIIDQTYRAMAIPNEHIYPLNLNVPSGRKAHGQGISNVAYKEIWLKVLGNGN